MHVVVKDTDDFCKLHIYNKNTKRHSSEVLEICIFNLLLLPGEMGLLVTDYSSVRKYWIINDKPLLVWKSDSIPEAYGLSIDEMGLIYIAAAKQKSIYILSADGKLWNQKLSIIKKKFTIIIIYSLHDLNENLSFCTWRWCLVTEI